MSPALTYVPCSACGKLNRVRLEASARKEPICGACRAALPVHHGVVEVNGAGLQALVVKAPLPVVCDFWAPWCGPCRAFAPVFQEAAGRFAGRVVFAKLNTEADPAAGGAHRVRGIPTLIYFGGGAERDRLSGALPPADFARWVQAKIGNGAA